MSVTETFPNQHAPIGASSQCAPGRIAIKDDTRVAFQNGMSMPISQNSTAVEISGNPRESSRGLTEQSVTDRIRTLAAQGLKARDISSMLHIHPQIVIRELADSNNNNNNSNKAER